MVVLEHQIGTPLNGDHSFSFFNPGRCARLRGSEALA